ncbi:MAG: hypothetical protein ACI4R8_00275 [Candidatus Caccovivens sp.]
MTDYEKLKNELDLLKSQVDDLSKQLIENSNQNNNSTDSGNTGDNGSSSGEDSTDESWIVLYDKDSTDPAINLGLTSGITGSYGRLTALPDVTPYNTMRVKFYAYASHQYHYFDISTPDTGGCRFLTSDLTSTILIGVNVGVGYEDNKQYIHVGNFTSLTFATNKYTTITNLKTNASFYISKIEVKTSAM